MCIPDEYGIISVVGWYIAQMSGALPMSDVQLIHHKSARPTVHRKRMDKGKANGLHNETHKSVISILGSESSIIERKSLFDVLKMAFSTVFTIREIKVDP